MTQTVGHEAAGSANQNSLTMTAQEIWHPEGFSRPIHGEWHDPVGNGILIGQVDSHVDRTLLRRDNLSPYRQATLGLSEVMGMRLPQDNATLPQVSEKKADRLVVMTMTPPTADGSPSDVEFWDGRPNSHRQRYILGQGVDGVFKVKERASLEGDTPFEWKVGSTLWLAVVSGDAIDIPSDTSDSNLALYRRVAMAVDALQPTSAAVDARRRRVGLGVRILTRLLGGDYTDES
ncbi:MAG TPA: hypothetical protein VLF69_00910 [Candidatus Saccharimonadales bacterium]|nr:hypothetical protein [Candidatus Saccharimonadales bacterium]